MTISAVHLSEQKINNVAPMALAGAALGALGRYVVPTKNEVKTMVNKEQVDTFVSSAAAATARANNRSITKSMGLGALVLGGATFVMDKIKQAKENKHATAAVQDYSKMGLLIDASPEAYAIYCYGDE